MTRNKTAQQNNTSELVWHGLPFMAAKQEVTVEAAAEGAERLLVLITAVQGVGEVGLDHGAGTDSEALEDLGHGSVADNGTLEDLDRGAVADSGTLEDLDRGAMAGSGTLEDLGDGTMFDPEEPGAMDRQRVHGETPPLLEVLQPELPPLGALAQTRRQTRRLVQTRGQIRFLEQTHEQSGW
ncbi:hypothetical protein M9458_052511 [Cirrhinus mrigala]|uniref:Uncharacterized protein n=1 Tax=Cirrhinus mrigala TaxID=683832 RepID=A0ABD0MUQ7_CIRMR